LSRFYFQLREGLGQLLDPDGVELPDLQSAKAKALAAARDTLSHEMKAGILDLRYRIEVEDSAGSILYSLPLGGAFEIVANRAETRNPVRMPGRLAAPEP